MLQILGCGIASDVFIIQGFAMNDLKGVSIKAVWTRSTHYFAVLLLVSICISHCFSGCTAFQTFKADGLAAPI